MNWLPCEAGSSTCSIVVPSESNAEELTPQALPGAENSSATDEGRVSPLFDDDFAEPSQTKGFRWIIASGLVMTMALGGWWGYTHWQRRTADPVMVTAAPPNRETLENRVDASGIVTLGNQQTLTAPEDVTVEAVLVSERQSVAAGEVLLRLRDRNLEQQLDEVLIESTILDLDYQRQQEILQERRRNVQRAEERLVESGELATEGYISEDALEEDRKALEGAQSDLRSAQIDLQKKKLELQKNQAAIANIQARIADNNIVAPFNAVVLNIDVSPGDGVPREGKLLTVGDPTQEMVRFDMMTLDAGKVSVNMPVRVGMIGPNPQKYLGRVVSIAPQAVSQDTSSNSSQASVQAVARLNQPSGRLIPGSSVSVEIILDQQDNALALPLGTVQQDETGAFVWVVDANNKAQKQAVITGLETLDAIEITSGLQETDRVILNLPPDQDLTEGQDIVTTGPGMPPDNLP